MIFALHKEILVKIGAYSDEKKRIGILFAGVLSFVLISSNVSSFIFIVTHMFIDLEITLFGILQVSALSGAICSLVVLSNNRKRVYSIEKQIQHIQG